jgi:hypothetical protein
MKNTPSAWLLTLHVCLASFACSAADGPDDAELESLGSQSEALQAPPLPSPTLAVPAGNKLEFAYDAVGAQVYACGATATGYGWALQAPDALLFNRAGKAVIKHYLGPTWEWIKDGSKVQAAKVAGFTDDPSAIPELLLAATTHDGEGRMDDVTYIQRLETTGGLAPTTGCDADHVGATSRVDYTATYYFYRASGGHCD